MKKYFTIFNLSWQSELTYRVNFLLWRLKNIMRFSMTYFLWLGIFATNNRIFGYTQPQMLTYVFLVFVMGSLVLSAPSAENIGSEIGNGELSNFLVKPIGYLKYWFTRDLASKFLNLIFAFLELGVIFLILNPNVVIPGQILVLLEFLLSAAIATCMYYLLSSVVRFVAFWTPENTWGLSFLVLVFIEILAGGIFPLDMLPKWIYVLLQFTPFPYLAYFPIAIFTGKIVGTGSIIILFQSLIWLAIMFVLTKIVWKKGIVNYQAYGK